MSYHVSFIPDGDGGGFLSFLQKCNSMLSPDDLEVVGLLEFRHSLKRSLFNLVRLSLMKIFSVWSRSLLRYKQFQLHLECINTLISFTELGNSLSLPCSFKLS